MYNVSRPSNSYTKCFSTHPLFELPGPPLGVTLQCLEAPLLFLLLLSLESLPGLLLLYILLFLLHLLQQLLLEREEVGDTRILLEPWKHSLVMKLHFKVYKNSLMY